jgi:hypothetical protein
VVPYTYLVPLVVVLTKQDALFASILNEKMNSASDMTNPPPEILEQVWDEAEQSIDQDVEKRKEEVRVYCKGREVAFLATGGKSFLI